MKKIAMYTMAAFALAGCSEEEIVKNDVLHSKVITASFDTENLDSRIAFDDARSATWTLGDVFTLFNESGDGYYYYLQDESAGSATGKFTTYGQTPTGMIKGAAYPYTEENEPSLSGTTLSMTLPSEYDYEESKALLPMWASSTDVNDLSFKHLAAIFKIKYTGLPEGCTQMKIEASNALSGAFTADLNVAESTYPQLVATGNDGENTVTINFTDAEADKLFYIPVPAGTYTSLKVTLVTNNVNIIALNKTNMNKEYKRGYMYTLSLGTSDATGNLGSDYQETENGYIIYTAEGLSWLAKQVNEEGETFKGKTITLGKDIDLENETWTSIGNKVNDGAKYYFQGTFDGNNKTISNLTAPLFANINGTVQNLTIANVKIEQSDARPLGVVGNSIFNAGLVNNVTVDNAIVLGNGQVGGIVGSVYGKVTGCTVKNSTITAIPNGDNGDKVGGIVGLSQGDNNNGDFSGNTVDNVTIKGYRHIGGVIGAADGFTVKNNKVSNVTIIVDAVTGDYSHAEAGKYINAFLGKNLDDSDLGTNNTEDNVTIIRGAINSGRIEYIQSSERYQIAADFAAAGVKTLAVKVLDQNNDLITTITPEGYSIPANGNIGTVEDNSQNSWTTVCAAVTGNSSSWQNTFFVPSANTTPTTMVLVVNGYDVAKCSVSQTYCSWSDAVSANSSAVTTLKNAIKTASDGETVTISSNVNLGQEQLTIDKKITLDLNGKVLTTGATYGGIVLKDGAAIKNGTINHTNTVAAIKVQGHIGSIENVSIICKEIEGKTITGIQLAVKSDRSINSLKNVTITGASQGIEVKDCSPYNTETYAIGSMENVKVDATNVGMIVNGYIGKASKCEFKGTNYGIDMLLKGKYKVALELEECTVSGNIGLYAHDEKGIDNNTTCSLSLTYDSATSITGTTQGLLWDFDEECKDVVTLNAPSSEN